MPAGFSITVKQDTITPDLRRRIAKLKDAKPVLLAVGAGLVMLTKRAFRDASVRASAWPKRKGEGDDISYDGRGRRHAGGKVKGKPLLIASGQLSKSPRIVSVSRTQVIVGASREAPGGAWNLAAIHQLGAPKRGIKPRPFFPFSPTGEATALARREIGDILRAKTDAMFR